MPKYIPLVVDSHEWRIYPLFSDYGRCKGDYNTRCVLGRGEHSLILRPTRKGCSLLSLGKKWSMPLLPTLQETLRHAVNLVDTYILTLARQVGYRATGKLGEMVPMKRSRFEFLE
jgi:hypothetical protein